MNARKRVTLDFGGFGMIVDEVQASELVAQGLFRLCGHCERYHASHALLIGMATGKVVLDLSSCLDSDSPAPLPPAQQARLDAILKGDKP